MANTNTKYSIEMVDGNGESDYITLAARTDQEAERALKAWLTSKVRIALPATTHVYLGFFRSSDGQHGYLNSDGASPTGKAWN